MKTLKKGSTGTQVQTLQCMLGVDADGAFGNNTRSAVLAFQKTYVLEADGIVGAKTWAMLAKTAPTVKYGSTGRYVRALQFAVGATPDGVFGRNTQASVLILQRDAGLNSDGIVGQLTWAHLLTDKAPATDTEKPMDYKQYDSRWKHIMYSNHKDAKQTIGNSGCGPTAMANIVATWLDPTVSPIEMCALAIANGYRTYNAGTAYGFFGYIAKQYGFSSFYETINTDDVVAALSRGALAVACMAPGYWTQAGHFITLWKTDGVNIYANDPASSTRTRASIASFKKERKRYFVFFK